MYSTFWLTDLPLYTQWVWGRILILDTAALQCVQIISSLQPNNVISLHSLSASHSEFRHILPACAKKRVSWHGLVEEDETSLSIYRILIMAGTSAEVRGQKTQVCLLSVNNCVEKVVKYLSITHHDELTRL
jgi:hypothetical protein